MQDSKNGKNTIFLLTNEYGYPNIRPHLFVLVPGNSSSKSAEAIREFAEAVREFTEANPNPPVDSVEVLTREALRTVVQKSLLPVEVGKVRELLKTARMPNKCLRQSQRAA
ncbi:hypothetical protein DFQ30_001481 [Apophysomyces sp. BC1015]|nr:hypothetical protein DFQ30_001481 [Apophysomyces sp. BC1015]